MSSSFASMNAAGQFVLHGGDERSPPTPGDVDPHAVAKHHNQSARVGPPQLPHAPESNQGATMCAGKAVRTHAILELTVIRVAWTFNLDFAHYILAGVIWMIGWCMILLAGLVRLRTTTIAAFGLVVIFAQNIVGVLAQATPESLRASLGWFWQMLYFGGVFRLGGNGPAVAVLYSIVPWIGVMAAGYAFGAIMVR